MVSIEPGDTVVYYVKIFGRLVRLHLAEVLEVRWATRSCFIKYRIVIYGQPEILMKDVSMDDLQKITVEEDPEWFL